MGVDVNVEVGVNVSVGVPVQVGLIAETVVNGAKKAVLGVWFEQEIPNKRAIRLMPVNRKTINTRFMFMPFLLKSNGSANREVQTTAVIRGVGSIRREGVGLSLITCKLVKTGPSLISSGYY